MLLPPGYEALGFDYKVAGDTGAAGPDAPAKTLIVRGLAHLALAGLGGNDLDEADEHIILVLLG